MVGNGEERALRSLAKETETKMGKEVEPIKRKFIELITVPWIWCFMLLLYTRALNQNLTLYNSILRRRQWHPTPVLLPGKSHGRRSLEGCSPWVRWRSDRLSDFTFTFHFHALEKETATHSSVLAWRILGTGEPGWLPSMGSHRVGHDCNNLAAAAKS